MNEQDIVKAINHRRHDWMNDLQLILGYIQLGNMDKLKEVVQRLRAQNLRESDLFHIGSSRLALGLYVLQSTTIDFEIDIQIPTGYQFKGNDYAAEQLLAWMNAHIKQLTAGINSSYNSTNILRITFQQMPDKWSVSLQFQDGQAVVGHGQLNGNEVQ